MSQIKAKCVYPDCNKNQIPHQSKNGLCPAHTLAVEFILWSLTNIRLEAKTPKDPEKTIE